MFGKPKDPTAQPRSSQPPQPRDEHDHPAAESHSGCCGGHCHSDPSDSPSSDPDQTQALIDSLTSERDDFKDKWLRAMAEYQNYQRRAIQNEQEARRQGVTSVLMSLVPTLDAFEMALASAPKDQSADKLLFGLTAVQQSLLSALANHGVSVIKPAPGDHFDPTRHSAIMQQPGTLADNSPVPSGHVSKCLQVGYALNDSPTSAPRVIRSAKVAVAPDAAM